MDKAKAERWLNRMVKVTKQYINVKDIPGIKRCDQLKHGTPNMPYCHLFTGLHTIAETLGIEVVVDYVDGDDTCYKFTYDGVDFIQLDHKDEEKK